MKIIFQQKTEYVKGCLWMNCVPDLYAVLLKNPNLNIENASPSQFFLKIFT